MKTYSVQFLTQTVTVYNVVADDEDEAREVAENLDAVGAKPTHQSTLLHDIENIEIAN
jgi:hypothetical protein